MSKRIDTGIYKTAAETVAKEISDYFGDKDHEDYNFGHYAMVNFGARVYVKGVSEGMEAGEAFIVYAIANKLTAVQILEALRNTRLALYTTSTMP